MSHPREKLRTSLANGLTHIMAAHSPLSARLAEEAGFDGVWASGFELSALYGVPDASLLSMTQHLEMTRAMAEQVEIPIVADLDTGYGNAINVRHVVRQYERADVAAVVLEDKTFPKATSLMQGAVHHLVATKEFQGKLAAALDGRINDNFLIIGRTEALIAGLGVAEALARACAYAETGADLILVHSKCTDPSEIESFVRQWNGARPIVIVPTAYPQLSERQILEWSAIRMVIYGNHAIRACVAAMRDVFAMIKHDRGIARAENAIATLADVLTLQRVAAMRAVETQFLPSPSFLDSNVVESK